MFKLFKKYAVLDASGVSVCWTMSEAPRGTACPQSC